MLLSLSVLVAGAGCGDLEAKPASAKPAPKAPPPAPKVTPRDELQRMHMHENFDLLRAIERLLIVGKLDDAKRFAAAISEAPDAPAHGPWAAHVVAVRDRAATLARATSVDQALRLEASLAAACASCHVETGVAPEFREFPVPPDAPTVEARMLRHRWAADRMWEGIMGGADEPWRAGLDVLAAAPLDWGPASADRTAHARNLQRLASQARAQKHATTEARATAYGEILTTCAGCHTAKPPPAAGSVPRR
jgi:cytochrome c553